MVGAARLSRSSAAQLRTASRHCRRRPRAAALFARVCERESGVAREYRADLLPGGARLPLALSAYCRPVWRYYNSWQLLTAACQANTVSGPACEPPVTHAKPRQFPRCGGRI